MKYCPTCETRYDEEILRFCMKDGTPLIDEEEPSFTTLPSESFEEDTDDEVTVIRRNSVPPPPPGTDSSFEPQNAAQRIVVPTYGQQQAGTTRVAPTYHSPAKPNTARIVVLTILGTLAVVLVAGGGLWFLQRDRNGNSNVNANPGVNTNLNTNLNLDNFNFNSSGNFSTNTNTNSNVNAVAKTPTPTPKPSPTATPSPSPSPTPTDEETPDANARPRNTPTPTPLPSPRNSPTPTGAPINGGVLNGRAISLPVPAYPVFARQVGAQGQVAVQVMVDERGNVISARAVSGHPLLRAAAEAAARQSRISPARIGEQNVRTTGVLLYNFRNN